MSSFIPRLKRGGGAKRRVSASRTSLGNDSDSTSLQVDSQSSSMVCSQPRSSDIDWIRLQARCISTKWKPQSRWTPNDSTICMKHEFFDVWNDDRKSSSVSESVYFSGRITVGGDFQHSIFEKDRSYLRENTGIKTWNRLEVAQICLRNQKTYPVPVKTEFALVFARRKHQHIHDRKHSSSTLEIESIRASNLLLIEAQNS